MGLRTHKTLIQAYLSRFPTQLSYYSFVYIFAWQNFFKFHVKKIEGHLCVFAQAANDVFLYWPPLGENLDSNVIEKAFEHIRQLNPAQKLFRMEHVPEEMLKFFPEKSFEITKRSDEYLYQRQDITQYKGNTYKSKRASYNQFVKQNPHCRLVPFQLSMREECLKLYDDWHLNRKAKYSDEYYRFLLEDNRIVHDLLMKHAPELDLVGRVVSIDGKIKAYSLGYILNDETFCITLEVADLGVSGLSAFIFSEFCRDEELSRFKYINAMDDSMLENLKETKMSYRPHRLIPSYTVKAKYTQSS